MGTSLLMVPLWLYLGVKLSLPWTWYLTVPVLLCIAAYVLADRMRHKRQPPEPGEPLRQHVESSLAQVERQIRLLRHVLWWYLMPIALSCLAFFGQVTWQERSGGWLTALAGAGAVVIGAIVLAGVYWLNQYAVRSELEPRRPARPGGSRPSRPMDGRSGHQESRADGIDDRDALVLSRTLSRVDGNKRTELASSREQTFEGASVVRRHNAPFEVASGFIAAR